MNDEDKKSSRTEQIDDHLKRVYEDMMNDEVPERFRRLLDRLKSDIDSAKDTDDSR